MFIYKYFIQKYLDILKNIQINKAYGLYSPNYFRPSLNFGISSFPSRCFTIFRKYKIDFTSHP